jgi:hypothetical protein
MHEKFREAAAAKAVPFLRRILERTGGTVLAGALSGALEGRDLDVSLSALEPMLNGLLMGRGPAEPVLSPMEAETVGLVYGVTKHEVERHWGKVHSCERHLKGVQLDDRYPMIWHKKRYSLPSFTEVQTEALLANFAALSKAAACARQLDGAPKMLDIVTQFRTKPIKNSAAAPPELANWLGLLLFICGAESAIKSWVETTLESYVDFFDHPQEAHKRALALQTFMSATLHDEFMGRVDKFVASLSNEDAARIGEFVGFITQSQDSSDRAVNLAFALRTVAAKVFATYNNWLATLLQKFESEKKHLPDAMHVNGVVTKSPAAFFARYKFGLCTRENTEMWREERHSHLVVFDEGSRSLVGMAMVYIQPIAEQFGGKPCMVIRAINVLSPDEIQVDACSAIDEIMRIAIDIAKKNGYAAVLFPRASTYFSNQTYVDRASFEAGSCRNATKISSPSFAFHGSSKAGALFWCKEQGATDGAVTELFVAWTSAGGATATSKFISEAVAI